MSKEVNRSSDVTVEVKKSREGRERSDRPREVHIEIKKSRRHTTGPLELRIHNRDMAKVSTVSANYAYVNSAFVGSTNNLNHQVHQNRIPPLQLQPPIDTVYREQYCICARWPIAKKILAIAVGLLFGAAMGLTLSMTLSEKDTIDFPILRSKPD